MKKGLRFHVGPSFASLRAQASKFLGWLMGLEPTTTGITIQRQPLDFLCKINALHFRSYNGTTILARVFSYERKNPL